MRDIALISIYSSDKCTKMRNLVHLFQLLSERSSKESISHKEMPTYEQHEEFVNKKPYKEWYLIQSLEEPNYPVVGCIYLTKDNEIGISIYDIFKRQHYATSAISTLMDVHKAPYYLANINPENYKSKEMFKRLGFKFKTVTMENKKIKQEIYKFTADGASLVSSSNSQAELQSDPNS